MLTLIRLILVYSIIPGVIYVIWVYHHTISFDSEKTINFGLALIGVVSAIVIAIIQGVISAGQKKARAVELAHEMVTYYSSDPQMRESHKALRHYLRERKESGEGLSEEGFQRNPKAREDFLLIANWFENLALMTASRTVDKATLYMLFRSTPVRFWNEIRDYVHDARASGYAPNMFIGLEHLAREWKDADMESFAPPRSISDIIRRRFRSKKY